MALYIESAFVPLMVSLTNQQSLENKTPDLSLHFGVFRLASMLMD